MGGANGVWIAERLSRQDVPHDFVTVDGESRICLNIIEETSGTSTELLEPGPVITPEAMEQLAGKLEGLAARSRVVCFSGDLPRGVPADYYAQLIRVAKSQGAAVFLDTSGEALRQGIRARPDFIKPNEEELAQPLRLTGSGAEDPGLKRRLDALHREGIRSVCVSMGAKGASLSAGGTRWRMAAPQVEAVNTVGRGDAFVAGFAVGTFRQESPEACLRLAVAAGAANALSDRAGSVDPDKAWESLESVEQIRP
ncbi:hexose kinase [Paenibacillus sp. P26]|nr:hexose kinase [Paenibacillus sp. P26]